MAENQGALKEAAGHLETSLDRHREGHSAHSETRSAIARIRELASGAQTEIGGGNTVGARAKLARILKELESASETHGDSGSAFSSARRSVEKAKGCLDRALEEPASHNSIANPSGAMGAQTSAGHSPRDYSPEAVRARDQQRAIEHAHAFRARIPGRLW
jgi:hypothetical protein